MNDTKQGVSKKSSEYKAMQNVKHKLAEKEKRSTVVRLLMEGKTRNEIIEQYRFSPAIMKSAIQRFERLRNNGSIQKRCTECGHKTMFRPDEAHLQHCLGCRIELGEVDKCQGAKS